MPPNPNPLTRTLSQEEVERLLILQSSFATDVHDAAQKIADAHRLVQNLDPEIILQEHGGNKIKLREFLTHFFQESPNTRYVARALVDEYPSLGLGDNDLLARVIFLSRVWLNSFLYVLKGVRHSTPTPKDLSTPLTPSATTADDLEKAQRDQKDLTSKVLPRDGYKDVIHRVVSREAPESLFRSAITQGEMPRVTVTTHILPFALNHWKSDHTTPQHDKLVFWDILVNWFGHDLSYIKGEGINRPCNAFTLQLEDHTFFGTFLIWFEAIDQRPNCYYLRSRDVHTHRDQVVEFSSENDVELPDPSLLKIHSAVARILHFSGVADVFDSMDNGDGVEHILSLDGSSDITFLVNRLWETGQALPGYLVY